MFVGLCFYSPLLQLQRGLLIAPQDFSILAGVSLGVLYYGQWHRRLMRKNSRICSYLEYVLYVYFAKRLYVLKANI